MLKLSKLLWQDQHRRALIALWTAAGLMIFLAWFHSVTLVSEVRTREMAAAERDLSNLTRVSQEHANRTFRNVDQVIRFVRSRYLDIGHKLDLADLTAKGVIDAQIFNQVGIIDENGIYVLANLPIKSRLDLSDREHFTVHKDSSDIGLFISKPLLGRASGKWSIQLTRRISRANGDFAGVVVVSIDPGYFTQFYGDLSLGPEGLAALYGLDGVARARKVRNKDEFGANAANSQMFSSIARNQLEGAFMQASVVDGVERLLYFRKVPDYPLVVVAGIDANYLLGNYKQARNGFFLQAFLATLLIVGFALALVRYLGAIRKEASERRHAQLQILDRTEQLNAIFALSPDGFISFDSHRRVKYVSPAFIQMISGGTGSLPGMSEEEFSNWLASLCAPSTPFAGVSRLREREGKEPPGHRNVLEIEHFGQRLLHIGFKSSESKSVSQILYFRDVTNEALVDRMKSEFLSTAAHELRTPMASIFGFSEVLLNLDNDTESRAEFLGIIHRQSHIMVHILDELLDLARIEARRGKDFDFKPVCIQELVSDLAISFKLPAGRSGPQLLMHRSPLYVVADIGKLRQALLNVLANAYKFSPSGGPVTITISAERAKGARANLVVDISDKGIGMTPEEASKVGGRFYRADTSGKVPGTGLGMSIVKEIVELHGGSVTIESQPGQGTTVRISLPLKEELVAPNSGNTQLSTLSV